MKALFAMDLIDGCAVRLEMGDFKKKKIYSNDPPATIREMIEKGARDFHIIDLDGARTGIPHHGMIIKKIRELVKGYIEVGGGIRTLDIIDSYSEMGIDGIIVGTAALEDENFFRKLSSYGNIVLGLDLFEGKPMARGWKSRVERGIEELLQLSEEVGVKAILCTSIARDGMLSGPDYQAMSMVMGMTKIPFIASGGVTTLEDVKRLRDMGAWAAILGKAVYEGRIKVEDVIEVAGIAD